MKFGTTAVLHADASGSNGLLRGLGERFFNVYGGVTRPTGSLCWGADRRFATGRWPASAAWWSILI